MRPQAGPAPVTPILEVIREAAEAVGGLGAVDAVAIAVPGWVNASGGIVNRAVNLGWEELPLAAIVAGELGLPCTVENDATLAAAGLIGSALVAGVSSFAYVSLGTGIGAGLVLDGEAYRGVRGMAGEVGHVVVEEDGSPCACGRRGCLETVAAAPGIVRAAQEMRADGGSGPAPRELTARDVYLAAAAGDAVAATVIDRAARVLTGALVDLSVACDLEVVVLGGGVALAGETLLAPVRAELHRLRSASPLVAGVLGPDGIRLHPRPADAVVDSAVAFARGRSGRGGEAPA